MVGGRQHPGASAGVIVAILGTRYEDFSIEEEILGPLGVEIVAGAGASARDVVEVARDARVILAGSGPRFDADTLERLSCRAIVRYGVGTDSIDAKAAGERGIWVAYVPDYGTEAVSVHALGLALAALRRLVPADRFVKQGGWGFADLRPLHLPSALSAGVIGFGRIGRRTAELFAGVGFDVLAHDALVTADHPDPRIRAAGLAEVLSEADVVSLHAPGDAAGVPLIGTKELGRMKEGSILVNTARGSLVDLVALIEGLRRGRPAMAALDVFPQEPPDALMFEGVSDRLVLSPHMAWYTVESETDLREKAAREAFRILSGRAPVNVAAGPKGVLA